jgi:tetratricopeptide (TPR) repeat protein
MEGRLSPAAISSVDAHISSCSDCSGLLAAVAPVVLTAAASAEPAAAPSPQSDGPPTLGRGVNIGRYVLLDLVGRGGMGEVYAAYDPELDRKLALKLLHRDAEQRASATRARARLLREAKSIARLSHPNVVVVHDAGTVADRVFIAMEFVEGSTLAEWLRESPRTWREVRDAFLAAGRGLEAAHAAGIVHRDFKPHNAMVSAGGVVRVMDFGLANDVGAADAGERAIGESVDPQAVALTRTGTLLGTPAYMAPEQFRGERADARTDQFSFCVAFYEALYGERPFGSGSLPALIEAVAAGRVREPVQKGGVPAWLRKIVLQGLRPNAKDRWPSMTELLAAIDRDPQRRQRQVLVGAALAAVLLGGGAVAERTLGRSGEALCVAGAAKLAGVWEGSVPGGARSPHWEKMRAAFRATGLSFAADTWDRVSAVLDRYGARWVGAYTDACRATHVRGEQSTETLDLRMDCLKRNLDGLRALTDVFAAADQDVVTGAVNAVSQLGDLSACDDVSALRAVIPVPRDAATRGRVEELRGRFAEMKALAVTGKLVDALARSKALLPELRRVGYDPLLAEALTVAGYAQRNVGDVTGAERSWEEAVTRALASRHDEAAADAMTMMAGPVALDFGRNIDAERWIRLADALLTRLGPGHERTQAWLEQARGNLRATEGRYVEAVAAFQKAVEIKERVLGRDHVDVAISLDSLALALLSLGDVARALATSERVLAIATSGFGAESPGLGEYLSNRGEILNAAKRPAEALPLFQRALEVWAPFGPTSLFLAYPLTGMGVALLGEGKPSQALAPLERALALRVAGEHARARLGDTRFALARALWEDGADRARARMLALQAHDDYAAPPPLPAERDEVDRWLAGHPAGRAPDKPAAPRR